MERGVTVISLTERDDCVLAELEEADGTVKSVEAAWVIGAGGAHSLTRESMSEDLAGSTYPGSALAADVRVSCGLPRDGSALLASQHGDVDLAPLPHGRWITFVGDLDESEAGTLAERLLTLTRSPAAIGLRIPATILTVDDVGGRRRRSRCIVGLCLV